MQNLPYLAIMLGSVFVPVIGYSFIAAFKDEHIPALGSQVDRDDDYMLAGRTASASDIVNSSAGYMLQVSTTFYFIFWGYYYGFSNLWYFTTWGLGILLYSIFAKDLIYFRVHFKSLPELVSLGNTSITRKLTALATVISFVGVFYVETYFSTDIITEITSTGSAIVGDGLLWWAIFATLLLIVTFYSVLGGLRAVIVTDTWQLSTTYICLSVVFSFLIFRSFNNSPSTALILLAGISAIYSSIFIVGWNTNEGLIKLSSLIAGFIIMLLPSSSQAVNAISSFQIQSINIEGISKQFSEPWGFVTMLGFGIINICWQFCDNSNYQRISALRLPEDEKTASKKLKAILYNISIVSPLTWGLGIIFGMLIKSSSIIPYIPIEKGAQVFGIFIRAIKDNALNGDILSLIVLSSLIASLIAIMMSTCDSAILAGLQVMHRDFLDSPPRISQKYLMASGIAIILLVSVIAFVHKNTGQSSILTVMNGAYSSILVLFPIAFRALQRKRISTSQGIASVLLGLTANFFATFCPPSFLHFNIVMVLPILAGFSASFLGYYIGTFLDGLTPRGVQR